MNDITALAQRMKAAALKADGEQWQTRDGFSGIEVIVKGSVAKGRGCVSYQPVAADLADSKTAKAIALFSPANVLALVEALEKAQTVNEAAEKLVRCKGRYHSEQNYRALAALFGVKTPDLPPLESESCTVTVKLPSLKQTESGERYEWSDGIFNYRTDVIEILRAAGIQVIEGEGQCGF